ncbi:MAG: nuclear transport factor 2 family protein [Candidatus Eremiobacteraeota bacterium]|nr:nuclear transport factor 2 family protein [Candidatus Eremiobacteraeota bacterium]
MESTTDLVQRGLAAFGRGDIPGLLELCADDVHVVFHDRGRTIPFAGTWDGKDRVLEYFRIIGDNLDVLKWETQRIVADRNHVVAFVDVDFRGKRSAKAAGETQAALDFTAAGGKITGWQVYADTAAWERVLRP